MKVRFYCDVPEYWWDGLTLFANQKPMHTIMANCKRVAFDVDFPDDVMKRADLTDHFVGVNKMV